MNSKPPGTCPDDTRSPDTRRGLRLPLLLGYPAALLLAAILAYARRPT